MKLFSFVLFFASILHAYPEMIRHGYVNCTTCHVSPNGGGLLTEYGRSLSREIVSTWGGEKETRWMYFLEPPKWLKLGGDVRLIQTYIDTPTYRQARFFRMQLDLEAGTTCDKIQFVGSVGKLEDQSSTGSGDSFISRRHFLLWHASDEMSLRGGRFFPAYGILTADHTLATRRGLGFDQGQETYNIEFAYTGENFDAFFTAVAGRPDQPALMKERGLVLRSGLNLNETYKAGMGYYYGHSERGNRHILGPYFLAGFRKNLYALFEADVVKSLPGNQAATTGLAQYGRLNYEMLQGLHFYLTQDLYKGDWHNPSTTTSTFGAGLQWFPRPHLELIAQYQKTKVWAVDAENFNDYLWFQFHFYP